jgi:excisionase family DNA binding protein
MVQCETCVDVNGPRLSRKEAARYLGLSVATLAADVVTRRHGIPYQKLGRRVLYLRRQLDEWAAGHAVNAPQFPEKLQRLAAGAAS